MCENFPVETLQRYDSIDIPFFLIVFDYNDYLFKRIT